MDALLDAYFLLLDVLLHVALYVTVPASLAIVIVFFHHPGHLPCELEHPLQDMRDGWQDFKEEFMDAWRDL